MIENPPELPKQEQLIKLLGMTTSANDAEALAFMRKANALLAAAGWSWEKLIRGKIRVLEDPFKSIPEPRVQPTASRPTPSQTPRPTWTPPPPRARAPKRSGKSHVSLNDL